MDRPFMEATIDELEKIFRDHIHKKPVLAKLKEELDHRSTNRADQLKSEIEAVLAGDIPIKKPPPEDNPDYQMTLEELLNE